jgi:pseudouridine synthase
VKVNGRVVSELGAKANPRRDRISVDGRPVHAAEDILYFLLNKPVGFVTTLSDPQGRPTIRDLLPRLKQRLYPVGRLDYHSAGLLLLTNDGELALRLTHPRYGVRKTYRVKVKGRPTDEALAQLRRGVELPDGRTHPAQVRTLETSDRKAWLEIVIAEGKRRQVRRMCEHVGLPVEKLVRTELGPLRLGKLPTGHVRELTPDEVDRVRRAVRLWR